MDVFSVQLRKKHPPTTDIRFSAHGSPYYKPVKLNGLVLMHREEVSCATSVLQIQLDLQFPKYFERRNAARSNQTKAYHLSVLFFGTVTFHNRDTYFINTFALMLLHQEDYRRPG